MYHTCISNNTCRTGEKLTDEIAASVINKKGPWWVLWKLSMYIDTYVQSTFEKWKRVPYSIAKFCIPNSNNFLEKVSKYEKTAQLIIVHTYLGAKQVREMKNVSVFYVQ